MKLTIDLPENLFREIELRAVREGRKLNEVVVELLREGIAAKDTPRDECPGPFFTKEEKKLPIIKCRHPAAAEQELTPERVAEILLEQEVNWFHDNASR